VPRRWGNRVGSVRLHEESNMITWPSCLQRGRERGSGILGAIELEEEVIGVI
jgi:hypothetical protein